MENARAYIEDCAQLLCGRLCVTNICILPNGSRHHVFGVFEKFLIARFRVSICAPVNQTFLFMLLRYFSAVCPYGCLFGKNLLTRVWISYWVI